MSNAETWTCTNEEYHASPGVSRSMLEDIAEPALYHGRYVTGDIPRRTPSAAMQWGSVADEIVTAPSGLGSTMQLIPPKVLSKSGAKAGKAWKQYANEHADKVLLKEPEYAEFSQIVDGIRSNGMALSLIEMATHHQFNIRWTDDETGLLLRCRIDLLLPEVLVDYKTSRDITPSGFASEIANFGYHRQAAFYRMGARELFGRDMPFLFIVSKNRPAYGCEVYELNDKSIELDETGETVYSFPETFLEIGERQNRANLRQLAKCQSTGKWKTPTSGQIITLSPPAWLVTQLQYQVED